MSEFGYGKSQKLQGAKSEHNSVKFEAHFEIMFIVKIKNYTIYTLNRKGVQVFSI